MWKLPTPKTRRTKNRKNRKLYAESLENRNLMAGVVFDSVSTFGNSDVGSTEVRSVVHDIAGNSYSTGRFSGTVDFDAGIAETLLTARGVHDIFVAKHDSNGGLVWAQQLGGDADEGANGTDIGQDIALGPNDEIYLSGAFRSQTQIGSYTFTSAGANDGFIAKLNTVGSVVAARRWGTSADELTNSIGTDASGNVYFVAGNSSINIFKFDSSLNLKWTKSIANNPLSPQVNAAETAIDGTGNVFVSGTFRGSVDFDPSSRSKIVSGGSGNAAFTLKLDNAGSFKWVSPFVGISSGASANGQSIAIDPAGNLIVGGYYSGAVDFNPGAGTTSLVTSGANGFITKLNATGGLVWAKAFENSLSGGLTRVYGIDTDALGRIYATGIFRGSIDLDPGVGSHVRVDDGSTDAYVVKLESNGEFLWGESITGTSASSQTSSAISVDSTGVVSVAGNFLGETDFDPSSSESTLRNSGKKSSGFLLRLRQN